MALGRSIPSESRSPGGTCAKVTHFGVKGAKVHRVQMRSKHAKVADGRHPPTNCAKAAAACARA